MARLGVDKAELRQIGGAVEYDGLLEISRAQANALGITYDMLDRYTGFTQGFWSKILSACAYSSSGKRGAKRHLSPSSFDALLGGLCFDLVAVENPEKVRKLKAWMERNLEKRVGPRLMPNAVAHRPIVIKLSLRHMKKLGKMSCAGRMKKIPARRRSELARNAAKARWHKPKLIEITAPADVAKLSALPTSQTSGITRGANKKTSPPQQADRSEARTVRRR